MLLPRALLHTSKPGACRSKGEEDVVVPFKYRGMTRMRTGFAEVSRVKPLYGREKCPSGPSSSLFPTALCVCESKNVKLIVAQLCPTLCNAVNCSPPTSPVHGILQPRMLEWVAIPFSRGSSRPFVGGFFNHMSPLGLSLQRLQ